MAQKKNSLDKQAQKLWGEFKDSAQFWRKHHHLLQKAQRTHQKLKSPPKPIDLPEFDYPQENETPSISATPTMPPSLQAKPVSVYNTVYGSTPADKSDLEKLMSYVVLIFLMVVLPILLVTLTKADEIFGSYVSTKEKHPVETTMRWFEGYKVNQDFMANYDSLRVDSIAWKKHELTLLKHKEREYETGFVNAVKSPQVIKEYNEALSRIRQKLRLKQKKFVTSYQTYLKQKNKKEDTVIVHEVPPQEIKQLEKTAPNHFIPHHRLIRFVLTKDQTSQRRTPHNLRARNKAVYQLFMPGDTLVYFIKGKHQLLHRVRKIGGKFYATMGKLGQLFKVNTARYHIYQADLTLALVVGNETRPVKGLKAILYKQQGSQKQFYIPQGEWLNTRLHLSVNAHAHYD